jgi:hypothetical protein
MAQLTPALFLSLVTAAVRVTESDPSTVDDDAVITTLMGFECPPQPVRDKAVHTNASRTGRMLKRFTIPSRKESSIGAL